MKKHLLVGAAGLLLAATVAPASADDVTASSVDFQVVADQNTIVMVVGDSSTVDLTYSVTNGDGKQGCNLTGPGSQLVLDVVGTGDAVEGPAGLSGVPASVAFEACDDELTDTAAVRTLSFTAVSPGTTTFTFTRNATSSVSSSSGTYDTTAATFVVTVLAPQEEVGRDAPAIANDWLHNTATAAELAACREANGTKNKSNWHGQLISKVAQLFEGQSFTASQESVVINQVKAYCGL
jgi:hypothetical protein